MAMINVGDAAPDFSLMGTDGKMHSISDYRGKAVVLFFFPKCFTGTCERQHRSFPVPEGLQEGV